MSKALALIALVLAVFVADAINPINEYRVGNPTFYDRFKHLMTPAKEGESPNYGSYVTTCDQVNQAVVFHNYPMQNCAGAFTNFTKPLNSCHIEVVKYSWNGFCNATNMWYNNFNGTTCAGNSFITRMYTVGECFNCPNPECKNGPSPGN